MKITIKADYGSQLKLNGIIGELNKQQSFPLSSFVSAESSSNLNAKSIPFNIVNHSAPLWESVSEAGQYIIVKFIDASVFITSLSIQCNVGGNRDFPRAMTFYGLKIGHGWSVIGSAEDKTHFNNFGDIVNFPVKHGLYNYIKIQSASRCERGVEYLCILNIDVFGYYNIFFRTQILNDSINNVMIAAFLSILLIFK